MADLADLACVQSFMSQVLRLPDRYVATAQIVLRGKTPYDAANAYSAIDDTSAAFRLADELERPAKAREYQRRLFAKFAPYEGVLREILPGHEIYNDATCGARRTRPRRTNDGQPDDNNKQNDTERSDKT